MKTFVSISLLHQHKLNRKIQKLISKQPRKKANFEAKLHHRETLKQTRAPTAQFASEKSRTHPSVLTAVCQHATAASASGSPHLEYVTCVEEV